MKMTQTLNLFISWPILGKQIWRTNPLVVLLCKNTSTIRSSFKNLVSH